MPYSQPLRSSMHSSVLNLSTSEARIIYTSLAMGGLWMHKDNQHHIISRSVYMVAIKLNVFFCDPRVKRCFVLLECEQLMYLKSA